MKNGPLFFIGILVCLLVSWGAIVLGSSRQISQLEPHYDALDNLAYPQPMPGLAAQGQDVYRSLGCGDCHTQQVRRPGLGYDKARGWGTRQSVARDYLLNSQVSLGVSRMGPDLATYGERAPKSGFDRARLMEFLYAEHKPTYSFLFDRAQVVGQVSLNALKGPSSRTEQVLPSAKAEALVVYLLSLKQDYSFPEAQPSDPTEENRK